MARFAGCPMSAWVKLRRTQCEHMFSALPSNSDIARRIRHVSKVKNGSVRARAARPFYPQEQTSSACPGMSVWCRTRTSSLWVACPARADAEPPSRRWHAHHFLEGTAERGFGLVADLGGDSRHVGIPAVQHLRCDLHPPLGEIMHRGIPTN